MKKCIVISDSFKGTLSSREICALARSAIAEVFPACQTVAIPVADGGEGTVDCFREALGAQPVTVQAHGPFGELVQAVYARKGRLAIVEMAAAAGLPLAGAHPDPSRASTYGVGEILRHAIAHGCNEILLGLGGSATNDGGCGCAAALGVRFLDANGREFVPCGGTLSQIAKIDASQSLARGVKITAMCDVDNPLCGPAGAAAVFAPQKGADAAMVARLDRELVALDEALRRDLGRAVAQIPGAGAAGGMGGGCMALLDAELKPGIACILDTVGFDDLLDGADLVITGEGRIDEQSIRGKVISGVAQRARARGVPLLAVVGSIALHADAAYGLGVTALASINRETLDFAASAPKSADNYRATLLDLLRVIRMAEGFAKA